jgi:tetratricopeptide (TPR) repeat protein
VAFRRSLLIAALAALLAGCAPTHETLARSALQENRLNDAVDEVRLALLSHPDNPDLKRLAAAIYTNRAARFYYARQIPPARADLQQALAYDPNYSAAWDYSGLVAFSEHNWKDAIADGERAGSLSGRAPSAYVEAARTQLVEERRPMKGRATNR